MLTALHLVTASPEPLVPLVESYNGFFKRLSSFYSECRKIVYLTSLVSIPQLPSTCHTFDENGIAEIKKSQHQQQPHHTVVDQFGSLEVSQADDESIVHNLIAPNINREVVEEANEQLMKLGLQLQEAVDKNIEYEELVAQYREVLFSNSSFTL
jgi:hypothetical protein